MVYYIILRGPAGVGKTTVGNLLAESLNGKCFSFDKILEKNGLDYIPGEKCVSEDNFYKANVILASLVNIELKNKKIVVIEGNFYHFSPLEDLIDQLDFNHFVFTLKASLEICLKREKLRNGCGEQGVKEVYKLVSRFDYGEFIITDNKESDQVVEEIKNKISVSFFD